MSKYWKKEYVENTLREHAKNGDYMTIIGDETARALDSLPTIEVSEDAIRQLQSYKDWVDLEDSEIIAECVHRYGGERVVKACEEVLKGGKE